MLSMLNLNLAAKSEARNLHNLLISYCLPHSLRSSDQHLLTVPFFKSSQARRPFLFAAPAVWNSLPLALRTSSYISSFHTARKTHLFPPEVYLFLYRCFGF